MIGKLLKFGILVVIGLLGYNYFLGTPEEKAKSKEIMGKVADVGKAGVGLIKDEVAKFKEGKYDRALDKISNGISTAKEKITDKGGFLLEKIDSWEGKKEAWQKESDRLKELFSSATEEEKEGLSDKIKALNKKGELLEEEGKELKQATEERIEK